MKKDKYIVIYIRGYENGLLGKTAILSNLKGTNNKKLVKNHVTLKIIDNIALLLPHTLTITINNHHLLYSIAFNKKSVFSTIKTGILPLLYIYPFFPYNYYIASKLLNT